MFLIEFMVYSAHLVLVNKASDPNECIYDVEALEEKRKSEENKWLPYQKQIVKLTINV